MPGNNPSLKARGLKIEVEDTDNYIWEGPLLEEEGSVSFYKKNGKAFGQIQKGNTTYEIYDLGDNEHVLVEYDNKFLDGKGCGVDDSFTSGKLAEEGVEETSSATIASNTHCNSIIVRVLVLYTSNAAAANPNINSAASMAVSKLNQGLGNSAVSGSQLRYELAGVKAFNFTETAYKIKEDVNALANSWAAQNERDAYAADLVVLLTDGNY